MRFYSGALHDVLRPFRVLPGRPIRPSLHKCPLILYLGLCTLHALLGEAVAPPLTIAGGAPLPDVRSSQPSADVPSYCYAIPSPSPMPGPPCHEMPDNCHTGCMPFAYCLTHTDMNCGNVPSFCTTQCAKWLHCAVLPSPQPSPQPLPEPDMICTNTCTYPNDDECDDGYGHPQCPYGSDCKDCGPRPVIMPPPSPPPPPPPRR